MAHSISGEKSQDDDKPKKVYIIIDNQKQYIAPEIVKKYSLDKDGASTLSGHKLQVESK
jgi:hypothetical protein